MRPPIHSPAFIATVLVLSLAALQASALCGSPSANLVSNDKIANFHGLSGVQGADITGSFWAMDAAVPGFGTANNHGTYASTMWLAPWTGDHYVSYTWADRGVAGCISADWLAPSRDNVVLVNDRINEGLASHAGRYIVARFGYDRLFGGYNADRIVNGAARPDCPAAEPNCVMTPALIPVPVVCASGCPGVTYQPATGAGVVQISFPSPDLTGYHDDRAVTLSAPVITGYEIHRIIAAAAPVTSAVAAWGAPIGALSNADCVGGTCTARVAPGAPIPPGQAAYFAVRLSFDAGFKSDFVSGNSAPVGAGAEEGGRNDQAPDFYASVASKKSVLFVATRWTTADERGLSGFDILVSRRPGSGYVLLNDRRIAAAGAPSRYAVNFALGSLHARTGPAVSHYLKLLVTLRDGTQLESRPVRVTLARSYD